MIGRGAGPERSAGGDDLARRGAVDEAEPETVAEGEAGAGATMLDEV